MTERLYLLEPGFKNDDGKLYYCPSCATVEGFLGFFPQVRSYIKVEYLPFPRPRQRLVGLLGPDHQSLPVLILDEGEATPDPQFEAKNANGRYFIDGEARIRHYLSSRFELPNAS